MVGYCLMLPFPTSAGRLSGPPGRSLSSLGSGFSPAGGPTGDTGTDFRSCCARGTESSSCNGRATVQRASRCRATGNKPGPEIMLRPDRTRSLVSGKLVPYGASCFYRSGGVLLGLETNAAVKTLDVCPESVPPSEMDSEVAPSDRVSAGQDQPGQVWQSFDGDVGSVPDHPPRQRACAPICRNRPRRK